MYVYILYLMFTNVFLNNHLHLYIHTYTYNDARVNISTLDVRTCANTPQTQITLWQPVEKRTATECQQRIPTCANALHTLKKTWNNLSRNVASDGTPTSRANVLRKRMQRSAETNVCQRTKKTYDNVVLIKRCVKVLGKHIPTHVCIIVDVY